METTAKLTLGSINLSEISDKTQATYRETFLHAKKTGEIFAIPINNVVIIEGWNDRMSFTDIPELAEGIFHNEGTDEIEGYLLKDGRFAVIDGERRTRAYYYLNETYPDVEWVRTIKAKLLPKGMTKQEMMVRKNTANNQKNWEPLEEAMSWRKMLDEGMSQADIAKALGKNRMQVSNRITLSNITKIEQEFVNEKLISTTEWVKLYKMEPDTAKRIDLLLKAKNNGEVINNALDSYAEELHSQAVAKVDAQMNAAKSPETNSIFEDEYKEYQSTADELNAGNDNGEETKTDRKDDNPFTGETPTPKTGLSALLAQSTVPPSEEPEPKIKTKKFTASEIISDEVGSTLGDQDPETGTITETLKEIAILMRALERFMGGDSRMTDLSFKLDKKLRYLQAIAKKNIIVGSATGSETTVNQF
jgi:ParB-like chromosome segregation protein Spo0J